MQQSPDNTLFAFLESRASHARVRTEASVSSCLLLAQMSSSTLYSLERRLRALLWNRFRCWGEGGGVFRNKSEKGETLEDVRLQETTLASHSLVCLEVDLGTPPTASGGFLNPSRGRCSQHLARPTSLILMAASVHTRGRSQVACQGSLSTELQGRFEPGLRVPEAGLGLPRQSQGFRATCRGVRGVVDLRPLCPFTLSAFSSWVCV